MRAADALHAKAVLSEDILDLASLVVLLPDAVAQHEAALAPFAFAARQRHDHALRLHRGDNDEGIAALARHMGNALPHPPARRRAGLRDDVHADGEMRARADAPRGAGDAHRQPVHVVSAARLGAGDDARGELDAVDMREAFAVARDEGADATAEIGEHRAACGRLGQRHESRHGVVALLTGYVAGLVFEF